jgi:hypothetical protein
MSRRRVRPPLPPLDEPTEERLLRGAPIEDLPEAYQPVGELLAEARRPGTDAELAGSAAAAATFVAVHAANTGDRPHRVRSVGVSALLVLTLAATTGTAVAATQGALPRPIQQVAHDALSAVGISTPGAQDDGDRNDQSGSDTQGDAQDGTPADSSTDPATGGPAASSVPSAPTTAPERPTVGERGGSGVNGGQDGVPQTVDGQNPEAEPGDDSGEGTPAPDDGNQGGPGDQGGGKGGGNGGGKGGGQGGPKGGGDGPGPAGKPGPDANSGASGGTGAPGKK